jgi:hypothetical protein
MKYKRIFLNLTEFRVQNAVGRLGVKGPRSNDMPRAPRNVNPTLVAGGPNKKSCTNSGDTPGIIVK